MNQKKCPNCGEYVPTNSLTCPKCFTSIPRETPVKKEDTAKENVPRNKNGTVALLLAVIPAFVGLLGLGRIYLEPKERKGYWFLVAGLLLFLPFLALFFTMLNSGFIVAILLFVVTIIVLLVYISAAIASILDTLFGSVFKILRFSI
jgi:Membrane-bound serine protease (ClpP class)